MARDGNRHAEREKYTDQATELGRTFLRGKQKPSLCVCFCHMIIYTRADLAI